MEDPGEAIVCRVAHGELLKGEIVTLFAALERGDVDRCLDYGFKPAGWGRLKAQISDKCVVGQKR